MAELENNLRVARKKAVLVRDAPAQDERVVVEFVVLSIHEKHFPDLRLQALEALGGKTNVGTLRGPLHDLGEVVKALDRGKPVALQDDLAFKVLNVIEGMAVAVGSLFNISNPFGLGVFLRILPTFPFFLVFFHVR